jgi:hypothetical protein
VGYFTSAMTMRVLFLRLEQGDSAGDQAAGVWKGDNSDRGTLISGQALRPSNYANSDAIAEFAVPRSPARGTQTVTFDL